LHRDSLLHNLFQKDEILVNSFHHQAVKDLAPVLKAVAHSQDGIIEAVEKIDTESFVLGVQWHPERMIEKYEEQMKLFEIFVQRCKDITRRG
ncbi:MAG: gamma-glutamyl-gamma-aminobutyrate hydrolase family protein, partial [Pseudothermotoga sp.]